MKTCNIIDVLKRIEIKPCIYIGSKSITRLRSFIDGYMFAAIDFDLSINVDLYNAFRSYMENKYNVKKSVLWDVYLMDITHDEAQAFNLFFDELNCFLKENNDTLR